MRIETVDTCYVKPGWLFLRVTTDTGITGWGEVGETDFTSAAAAIVETLAQQIRGEDPTRIEAIWQQLHRGAHRMRGGLIDAAISGIEMALWDITGKHLERPVHALLGGALHARIRMSAGCRGRRPEDSAATARARTLRGFTALVLPIEGGHDSTDTGALLADVVNHVSAVRDEVGPEIDIAVDFHGELSPSTAIRVLRELEPFNLIFAEEPCAPEHADALARVARATSVQIAAGESLATRWGFRELLEKHAIAVAQPAVSQAGGILETRRIAAMAEVPLVPVALHNAVGPIALAASLQVAASTPNFLLQGHAGLSNQWDLGQGYLHEPFHIREGGIAVPEGPGLGIDINEDILAERAMPLEAAKEDRPDG